MMYGYDGDGRAWAWMAVMMPLMWIALIAFTVWAVARLSHNPSVLSTPTPHKPLPTQDRETAEDILDRRFAAGEIDAETYAAARKQLKEYRG